MVPWNRDSPPYLLELALPHFVKWRSGVKVGTIRGREIQEVVFYPGCNLVHETLRIDKGGRVKQIANRDRGPLDGSGCIEGRE